MMSLIVCFLSVRGCTEQLLQIERFGDHSKLSVLCTRPLLSGPIPVKLHAVAIWITQVNSLAYPVIRRSFKGDASPQNPSQGVCEF